jgi:hypothetical protein
MPGDEHCSVLAGWLTPGAADRLVNEADQLVAILGVSAGTAESYARALPVDPERDPIVLRGGCVAERVVDAGRRGHVDGFGRDACPWSNAREPRRAPKEQ